MWRVTLLLFLVASAFAQSEAPNYPNPILSSEGSAPATPIQGTGGVVVEVGEPGATNAIGADSAGQPAVLRMELDEDTPAVVPTATLRTTVLVFPFPIRALEGVGFTRDPATVKGDFLISATSKSNRVAINPLKDNVRRNLTVVSEDGKVFPLDIIPARPPGAAAFVIHFRLKGPVTPFPNVVGGPAQGGASGQGGGPTPEPPMAESPNAQSFRRALTPPAPGKNATPARLQGAIGAAKLLTGLTDDSEAEKMIALMPKTYFRRGSAVETTALGDLDLRLLSCLRSDGIDTVVLAFSAKAKTAISLNKETWGVRVKDGASGPLLRAAMVDAPAQMAPGQTATVYLAFAGSSDGGRNRVGVENFFFPSVTTAPAATTPKPSPRK